MGIALEELDSQVISWIKWFMIVVTVLFPFGIYPSLWFIESYTIGQTTINSASVVLLSFLWAYSPSSFIGGFIVLEPSWIIYGLAAGVFNILFAVQVVRYCRDMISWNELVWTALLTLVIPTLSLATLLPTMMATGVYAYLGPVPIQLLIGLWIARRAGIPVEHNA